jgi:hypothetical protein
MQRQGLAFPRQESGYASCNLIRDTEKNLFSPRNTWMDRSIADRSMSCLDLFVGGANDLFVWVADSSP